MLAGFLDLADAVPAELRDYAARWGPLGLDESGEPRPGGYPEFEFIDNWRSTARLARAIVRGASAIRLNDEVAGVDRAVLIAAARRTSWPVTRRDEPTDHGADRRTSPLDPSSLLDVRLRQMEQAAELPDPVAAAIEPGDLTPEQVEQLASEGREYEELARSLRLDELTSAPEDYPSWRDPDNVAHLASGWLRSGRVAPTVCVDKNRDDFAIITACPSLFSALGIALACSIRDAVVCRQCGRLITSGKTRERYCSAACRTAANTERKRRERAAQVNE
jgi:hypothetical protein